MRTPQRVILSVILTMIAIFPTAIVVRAADTPGFTFEPVKPTLQIDVPTLRFSDVIVETVNGDSTSVSIPWIGDYIAALYRWAVPVGAVLAALVIMVAGMIWLTSAGAGRLSTAKDWITNAMLGLMLLVGSYVILNLVNPDLVRFAALKVQIARPVPFETSGDTDAPISYSPQTAAALGFTCPGSGGTDAIPAVINSMRGKVAYRFGGKGRPPPYSETPNGSFTEFNSSCPDGNMCLDCSGFINYVLRCAGLSAPGGGTGSIFSNAESITNFDARRLTANGVALKPGDLLGWKAGESHEVGHVIMYIGGGQVAESKGGRAGRQPGANPTIRPLAALGKGYTFTWIRRM